MSTTLKCSSFAFFKPYPTVPTKVCHEPHDQKELSPDQSIQADISSLDQTRGLQMCNIQTICKCK
jgi:hypothetical protein